MTYHMQCMIFIASPKPMLMSEVNQYDQKFRKVWLVRYTYAASVVLSIIDCEQNIFNINVLFSYVFCCCRGHMFCRGT